MKHKRPAGSAIVKIDLSQSRTRKIDNMKILDISQEKPQTYLTMLNLQVD